jgi:dienelactone hydrolase
MSIEITFQRDNLSLSGKMHPAQGTGPFATVILLHGSPGNEDDVLDLGQKLSQHHYNVLTFNYSGTYESEGRFSFADTQLDIRAAYMFLHQSETLDRFKIDVSRLYLGGWSYGGGMALTYTANHPAIHAAFSISGMDPGALMREYAGDSDYQAMIDEIFEQYQRPDSPLRPAPGATPKEIFEQKLDITPYDLRLSASALASKHLLLIGGWDDLDVRIDNHMLPLYRTLRTAKAKNVSILAFQDDHAFANVRDELAAAVLDWMKAIERQSNMK